MSRRRLDSADKIALPIAPMLDMTFQLLFFFVMNFNPTDLEGQIDAALPSQEFDRIGEPHGGCGNQIPREFPIDLTVEVRTQNIEGRKGGITGLFVKGLDGKSEAIDGLDALKKYLVEKRATLEHADAIGIRGDNRLCVEHLMKVMDICKAAGFSRTTLLPPEELGR